MNELTLPVTLKEIFDGRERMKMIRDEIAKLHGEFNTISNRITASGSRNPQPHSQPDSEFKTILDSGCWRFVGENLGLFDNMSSARKTEFIKKNTDNPDPFTQEAVYAVMQSANAIYGNSTVTLFKETYNNLIGCSYYGGNTDKHDNLTRVEKSFRCRGTINWSKSMEWWTVDQPWIGNPNFDDLMRVCRLIDGETNAGYEKTFRSLAGGTYVRGNKIEVDCEYFTVEGFKNGNQKVTWKRIDILEKLNSWCSDSTMLPDTLKKRYKKEDRKTKIFSSEPKTKKVYSDLNFFVTPTELADRIISLADVANNHTILEPSAGEGDIAERILNVVPDALLTVIEYDEKRYHSLKVTMKNKARSYNADFLDHYGKYDRIIMNPPFSENRDVIHVMKAFELLNEGGKIVAITSSHWTFANDQTSVDFRDWLSKQGATWEEVGSGAFKTSGTMVNTIILEVSK